MGQTETRVSWRGYMRAGGEQGELQDRKCVGRRGQMEAREGLQAGRRKRERVVRMV